MNHALERSEGEGHDDDQIRQILESTRTIAVVGLSANPERPSHSVPAYLKSQGYRIIPVNPGVAEVLGEKAYPDLASIPEKIDAVEIFRPSSETPAIVQQAIQVGARTVWMQEGISNPEAAETAQAAGLNVVMDRCMRKEHRRLFSVG